MPTDPSIDPDSASSTPPAERTAPDRAHRQEVVHEDRLDPCSGPSSRPPQARHGWRDRRDAAQTIAHRWSRSTPVLALQKWSDDQCATRSAGIAFYVAFSMAPTLIMVIVVAGWFFGAAAVSGQLFHQLSGLMGAAAATEVQSVVAHAHRSGASGWATLFSFLVLAVGASATFSTLNQALNVVWPAPARGPAGSATTAVIGLVKVRLVSLGLVLGIAFLLIVSLILDAAVTFVGQWLWTDSPWAIVGDGVQTLLAVGVLTAAFATLIKFLPTAPVRWHDAIVGGLAAAVLFAVGKKLFALYLVHAGLETSFGAAGSLAVLLMWLYFSAAVFLLGAEFAAVRAGHRLAGGPTPDAAPSQRREHPGLAQPFRPSSFAGNAKEHVGGKHARACMRSRRGGATDSPASFVQTSMNA